MSALRSRDGFEALRVGVDERDARRELRRQIARMERELSGLLGEAFGRVEIAYGVAAATHEPRLLDLGELERVRDALAERIAAAP